MCVRWRVLRSISQYLPPQSWTCEIPVPQPGGRNRRACFHLGNGTELGSLLVAKGVVPGKKLRPSMLCCVCCGITPETGDPEMGGAALSTPGGGPGGYQLLFVLANEEKQ
ncbi:hypothetical protein DPX16_19700 [Anabarilius grahami]|uniref:Uncharacterized protein n=1 Tax=Anabarilius grahami TaxID=495550 RepID=A0A3N0XQ06_ANAGA|nr:hypothetical protein DPX16_19700 [Anabarilius grahami]